MEKKALELRANPQSGGEPHWGKRRHTTFNQKRWRPRNRKSLQAKRAILTKRLTTARWEKQKEKLRPGQTQKIGVGNPDKGTVRRVQRGKERKKRRPGNKTNLNRHELKKRSSMDRQPGRNRDKRKPGRGREGGRESRVPTTGGNRRERPSPLRTQNREGGNPGAKGKNVLSD